MVLWVIYTKIITVEEIFIYKYAEKNQRGSLFSADSSELAFIVYYKLISLTSVLTVNCSLELV